MRGLLSQPGVDGFLVFNETGTLRPAAAADGSSPTAARGRRATRTHLPPAGIPLKWTTSGFVKPSAGGGSAANPIPPSVVHYASLVGDLTAKSRATAKKLLGEADGELQLLRLRTHTNEMIIAPSDEATLVVLQKAHSAVMVPLVAAADTSSVVAGAGAAGAAPTGAAEEKKADK